MLKIPLNCLGFRSLEEKRAKQKVVHGASLSLSRNHDRKTSPTTWSHSQSFLLCTTFVAMPGNQPYFHQNKPVCSVRLHGRFLKQNLGEMGMESY